MNFPAIHGTGAPPSGGPWVLAGVILVFLSVLFIPWQGPLPARAETQSLSTLPPNGPAREAALLDLLAHRDRALALVRSGLAGGRDRETLMALSLAVEMNDRESGPAISALLTHANPRISRRAALCLGRLRYEPARMEMERLLAGQTDPALARALICGLGLLGDARSVPALQPFVDHAQELVRVDAASALAALGQSQGLNPVLKASRSQDRTVRLEAVFGLRFFSQDKAGTRLERMASDPAEIWRQEARVSQAARELAGLEQNAGVREGFLLELLNNPQRMVGLWAVQALADLDTTQAGQILQTLAREPTRIGRAALQKLLARGVAP